MSDVFYDVKSDGGGDFLTINAAITQIESDEGATPFTSNRIIRVFELGTDYTDIAIPASSLSPTETNRFIILGIAGTSPRPFWVRGTTGINLTLNFSNFTIDNMDMENDNQGGGSLLDIGVAATAADGIIKKCVLHGLDVDSNVRLIRIRGQASDTKIFNNKFHNRDIFSNGRNLNR